MKPVEDDGHFIMDETRFVMFKDNEGRSTTIRISDIQATAVAEEGEPDTSYVIFNNCQVFTTRDTAIHVWSRWQKQG